MDQLVDHKVNMDKALISIPSNMYTPHFTPKYLGIASHL